MQTYSPVSFSVAANSFEYAGLGRVGHHVWRVFHVHPSAFVLMSYWVLLNLIIIKDIHNQISAIW